VSPVNGLFGRNSPLQARTPPIRIPQSPPSPEYSNLDCAFPPFPVSSPQSATPTRDPTAQKPSIENDYVREHAEPYNQSRPASPVSLGHSRVRSLTNSRNRDRSGTTASRNDAIPRPSTAGGTTKPTLGGFSTGPKPSADDRPPLPTGFPTIGAHLNKKIPQAGTFGSSSDYGGLGPEPFQRAVLGTSPSQRPLSPSRTQTFPLHNEDRMSGNGPNSFVARRSSQPSAKPLNDRTPFLPDRNPQRPERTFLPYNAPPPHSQAEPKAGQFPPRTASRNGSRPASVNRPFPVRKASRAGIRPDLTALIQPPLPSQTIQHDFLSQDLSHTPSQSSSSTASNTSAPQSGSSRSTPPSDLALPPRDLPSFQIPDSPTDPLFQQGRLSPIPRGNMNKSPFSTSSTTSSTSRSSSRNQSLRGPRSRPANNTSNKRICRGCSKPIMAGEKSISSKDGRLTGRYHRQCFACHTCKGPFETADFYVHEDHPFCAQHYHSLNGSLCCGCGHGIEGQYLQATTTKEKDAEKFHPDCLTCSTCRIALQNDYFEWNGKVYCDRDAKRAAEIQYRPPNGVFLSAGPCPSPNKPPAPDFPGLPSRPGLPAGPRAGLRPPGPSAGMSNAFLSPFPRPPGGGRFPERRTTKLMMM
jgi:LIM domain